MMKTKSLVNAAMTMAIYLVFFTLYSIGIFPEIIMFLLPIPLIVYSLVSRTTIDVILLLVGCSMGSYLIGSIFGLMTTVLYGGVGAMLGIGMMKKWPYWNRILNASILFLIGMPLITFITTGMNLPDMIVDVMNEGFTMFESMLPQGATEQFDSMQKMMQTFIPMIMPTGLILMGGLNAFVSDKIACVILKRMKLEIPKREALGEFQLGAKLAIILMISQLAMTFITNYGLSVILLNIVFLLNALFMIQGAIVAIQFFKSRNQNGLGILVVVFAFLSNLSMFVSLVGMMDALFDYRERFAVKGS